MTLPHEDLRAPVPHWLIKLFVRRDLRHGRYVPERYRTPYWAGKWATRMDSGLPNPGSDEAQANGCLCAIADNNYGKIAPFPPGFEFPHGSWYVRVDCPMHGSSYGVEENQTGDT